ncbi:MAG TPA: ABC transporter ATP-binding protein [Gemmatimonadaceae bacterium]|nr:ABC transporter ATP-binding protein [Gemmatimonadaceae bacterium]
MIELHDVTKIYRSPLGPHVRAVEGFSLTVGRGEVVGLAGPNGAGKSTLINILLGYLSPTAGTVTIGGIAPRDYIEANGVGDLSELVAIPPAWTVRSALVRYAVLAGLAEREIPPRVADVIVRLGLGEHERKKVRQLSKGTLQRLGLAQALLGDPDVLILDEPAHGLDPTWTLRFPDLVGELRRPVRAMLVVSHDLDELERTTDRVAIMHRGRLARLAEMDSANPSLERHFREATAEATG